LAIPRRNCGVEKKSPEFRGEMPGNFLNHGDSEKFFCPFGFKAGATHSDFSVLQEIEPCKEAGE